MASSQDNKATFLHLFDEVFRKHNTDAFQQAFAPDVIFHLAGLPRPLLGRAEVERWATQYLSAWDAHFTIEDVVAEGDMVAARWSVRATHRGEYLDIPPTGRPVAYTQLYMARFAEGQAAEVWILFDSLGAVQQLGLFPKGRPPRGLLRFIIWLQRLGGKTEQAVRP